MLDLSIDILVPLVIPVSPFSHSRPSSVIPVKTEIQTNWIPSQAGDDKECVIPVKTGIQTGMDPQSS